MEKPVEGVVGFFEDQEALIRGAARVKEEKRYRFDTFTPFPVHGIFEAQGVKRSILPVLVFVGGLTGCAIGFLGQYWTSAVDWPLIVGGKPFFSGPAFIPVTFEVTILLSALTTVIGMFALNRLPNLRKRSFDPGITRDRFALLIEADEAKAKGFLEDEYAPEPKDPPFDADGAMRFLQSIGAKETRVVHREGWFQ